MTDAMGARMALPHHRAGPLAAIDGDGAAEVAPKRASRPAPAHEVEAPAAEVIRLPQA